MLSRSIGTALVLTAAAMALSACNGNGNGGGGGSDPDRFFGQTFGAAPNTDLATFQDEADGEKISITQHTGSMMLSSLDLDLETVLADLLEGTLPDVSDVTIEATADGSDENPAHINLTETDDFDFIFRVASTGDLEMLVFSADSDPVIIAIGATDITASIEEGIGDDAGFLIATAPGEFNPGFGTLDFMSVAAWFTFTIPDPEEILTELALDFGVGHLGLVTPEADIGDIPAERLAHYFGGFVGLYVEPGPSGDNFAGIATGDAAFEADFAGGFVDGGVSNIVVAGMDLGDADGLDFDDVTISGNTFSGSVVPGEDTAAGFAAFDPESTGPLDGVFYGPVIDIGDDLHMGPAEAGIVLTLVDATPEVEEPAFITGVVGAVIDD